MNIALIWGVSITREERYDTVTRPGCAHEVAPEHKHCPQCGAAREIKAEIDRYERGPVRAYGDWYIGVSVLGALIAAVDDVEFAWSMDEEALAHAKKTWSDTVMPAKIAVRTPSLWLVVEEVHP